MGGTTKIASEYIYYRKVGDHATNMPSCVYFGNRKNGKYVISDNVKYEYDKNGNICKIYENGALTARYTYDALDRLVREDNKTFGKTYLYAYDNCGNILSRRETNFTLKEDVEECTFTSVQYAYEGDRLISVGDEACAYDEIGNPTTYRGKAVTWANGRQMTKFDTIAFAYDGQGRRRSKGSISFTYDKDGRVVKQSNGLEFIYDQSGIAGIKYNNTTYFYRKDAQGNIAAILDSNGNVVVKYKYDAWGNHAALYLNKVNDKEQYSEADEAAFDENYAKNKTLAELNPFRYRGYYYDTETGLYFLKTRYYDPEVGRFITIDDISYIDPETINGLNLYAYCGNNPVMRVDENGNAWWQSFLSALAIIAVVAAVVAVTVVTGGAGTLIGAAVIGGTIAAGADALGQVVFKNKTLTSLDWGSVGISFASGFIGGLIPGSGALSVVGSAFASSVTENALLAVAGRGAFSIGKIILDTVLSIGIDYALKGIAKGVKKELRGMLEEGPNYSTWQGNLRKKGFNYTMDEVNEMMRKTAKKIDQLTMLIKHYFAFIYETLRGVINI